MTTHDRTSDPDRLDGQDAALRWSLRALRRDALPANDLWPAIAGRIAVTAQRAAAPARAVPLQRRPALLAMAASLLVALGLGWQMLPARMTADTTGDPNARLLALEAQAMTIEYGAALRELDAGQRPRATQPALRELDRSAAQVRTALARDPDARFLLDRLQSLYARRLALTQRLAALT